MDELTAKPQVLKQPIDILAKDNGVPKCANIILLGMAAHFIEILTPEELYESVERVFATKGVSVVQMNQQAFTIGYNIVKDHENI